MPMPDKQCLYGSPYDEDEENALHHMIISRSAYDEDEDGSASILNAM